MEIPGWLYLLVGFAVSGMSYYVNTSQSTGKMIIFLAIGIVLMIIGIIKIIFGSFKDINKYTENSGHLSQFNQSNKTNNGNDNFHATQAYQSVNQVHTKNKQGFRQSRVPGVKYCSNCGQILRFSDNFCFRCGNRS